MNRPINWREAAIVSALMLATFVILMTGGYWLRHDRMVWEDLRHVVETSGL